jgi:hypothetical protein
MSAWNAATDSTLHAADGGAVELGLFGAMALLAVLDAGAEPGYRLIRAHAGFGPRLAPHRVVRHHVLSSLLESGVLAPIPTKVRLDDRICDAKWETDPSLEDADWQIVWGGESRRCSRDELSEYLQDMESSARVQEVLLQTWQLLGTGECLAFGEYALACHNLNPAIARCAAAALPSVLARHSIGQGCGLMWSAAKHVASAFMRHGIRHEGTIERDFVSSLCTFSDRASGGGPRLREFSRHASIPLSTLTRSLCAAGHLAESYWSAPVSESSIDRAFLGTQ